MAREYGGNDPENMNGNNWEYDPEYWPMTSIKDIQDILEENAADAANSVSEDMADGGYGTVSGEMSGDGYAAVSPGMSENVWGEAAENAIESITEDLTEAALEDQLADGAGKKKKRGLFFKGKGKKVKRPKAPKKKKEKKPKVKKVKEKKVREKKVREKKFGIGNLWKKREIDPNKPKKSWKHYTSRAIAVLVIGSVLGVAMYAIFAPKDVDAIEIAGDFIEDRYSVTGVYGANSRQVVLSNVEGKVLEVPAILNYQVSAGEVVARVSASSYLETQAALEAQIASLDSEVILAKLEDDARKQKYTSELGEMENQEAELDAKYKQALVAVAFEGLPSERLQQMELSIAALKKQKTGYESAYDAYKTAANDAGMAEMKDKIEEIDGEIKKLLKNWEDAKKHLAEDVGGSSSASYATIDSVYKSLIAAEYEKQKQVLQLQSAYLKALSEADTLTATLAKLEAERGKLTIALENVGNQIADCEVKAPIDGVVVSLPVQNVNYLSTGDEVMTIVPVGSKLIRCDVLSNYADSIHEGDAVTMSRKVGNNTESFTGTVAAVYDYALQKTSSLGLSEYRVQVLVEPEEGISLRDGADVQVTFTTYYRNDVLVVPISALMTENGNYYVYCIEEENLIKQKVTVAYRTNDKAEISEGLLAGDVIVKNANTPGLEKAFRIRALLPDDESWEEDEYDEEYTDEDYDDEDYDWEDDEDYEEEDYDWEDDEDYDWEDDVEYYGDDYFEDADDVDADENAGYARKTGGQLNVGAIRAGAAGVGKSKAGTVDAGTINAGAVGAGTIKAGDVEAATINADTVEAGAIGTVENMEWIERLKAIPVEERVVTDDIVGVG